MKELIEATLLVGQPDAGIFIAALYGSTNALYFGDADIVSDDEYEQLPQDEQAEYSRLDNHWVLLSPGVNIRLTQLDVRVSAKYEAFYFAHSTLWERRFD